MLWRMLVRWAERRGFKVTVNDYQEGDEAGIKSVTMTLEGPRAYGLVSAETGTHRLVRISPYDQAKRRHTSFAAVDAIPVLDDEDTPEIDDADLRVDVFRSSGPGGQGVNTTDSAVRVTHLPTGIVVAVQNERSQLANKTIALKILAARLAERARKEREAQLAALRGDRGEIAFGSQIRSYVLHPYQMVKDHRTERGDRQRPGGPRRRPRPVRRRRAPPPRHPTLVARLRRPAVAVGLLVAVYIGVFGVADLGPARQLRDLRLRHGPVRPGDLAAVPVPGPVRDHPGAGLLRAPREPDHGAVRARLLAGGRPPVPVPGGDGLDGAGGGAAVPAGPRPAAQRLAGRGRGRLLPAVPVAGVDQLVALPPRRAGDHAAAVRLVAGPAAPLGLVRGRGRRSRWPARRTRPWPWSCSAWSWPSSASAGPACSPPPPGPAGSCSPPGW